MRLECAQPDREEVHVYVCDVGPGGKGWGKTEVCEPPSIFSALGGDAEILAPGRLGRAFACQYIAAPIFGNDVVCLCGAGFEEVFGETISDVCFCCFGGSAAEGLCK